MGKVLRRRSAAAVLMMKRKEDQTGLEGGGARSQGLVGHGDMGTKGTWGLEWSGEETTTGHHSAPAEAVYAVHGALPNLLWGHVVSYVPCTEPQLHPPTRFVLHANSPTAHFVAPISLRRCHAMRCDARGRARRNLPQQAIDDPRSAHCVSVLT